MLSEVSHEDEVGKHLLYPFIHKLLEFGAVNMSAVVASVKMVTDSAGPFHP